MEDMIDAETEITQTLDADYFFETLGEGENFEEGFAARVLSLAGVKVFPVQEAGKHTLPGRLGMEDATTDAEQINEWWPDDRNAKTRYGVAIIPASAGLAAVTVDDHHGVRAWKQITGIDLDKEAAIVTKTPSGGRHYWFRLPDPDEPPAATHTAGLGLKTDQSYCIVSGGKSRKAIRPYEHTRNEQQRDWTDLTLPMMIAAPASEYGAACSDQTTAKRVERLSKLVVAKPEMTDLVKTIAATTSRAHWNERSGLPARCEAARMVIQELANAGSQRQIHLASALEEAVKIWLDQCAEEDGIGFQPEASALVWAHMRNLVFASDDFDEDELSGPISNAPVVIPDLDWSKPFGHDGKVKRIPLDFIGRTTQQVATVLSEVWEVPVDNLERACKDAYDKAIEDNVDNDKVDMSHVYWQVFRESDAWFAGSRLKATAIHALLKDLCEFRKSVDGSLFRYNSTGRNSGLWTEDGRVFLTRMLERILGERYVKSAYDTIFTLIEAQAQGINMPMDLGTWQNYDLLYCQNGVVNFKQPDGQPRPPRPEDLLTVKYPFDWQQGATCPEIDQFLAEIFEEDAVETVYEIAGVAMYQGLPVKEVVLLYGGTDTGKTTALRLVTALVGKENMSNMSLQQLGSNNFAASYLFGKLVNVCGDIGPDGIDDPGLFKTLTGGDTISADRKYREAYQFENKTLLIFSANELPGTRDRTDAYYRRFLLMPCEKVIPPHKKNPNLLEELTTPENLAGFAQKAVAGLWRVLSHGAFTVPTSSQEARKQYIRTTDNVTAWFEDCIEVTGNEDDWIDHNDLRRMYAEYCEQYGWRAQSDGKVGQSIKKIEREHDYAFKWHTIVEQTSEKGTPIRRMGATGVRKKETSGTVPDDERNQI